MSTLKAVGIAWAVALAVGLLFVGLTKIGVIHPSGTTIRVVPLLAAVIAGTWLVFRRR